jgi:hypothetical protein
MQFGKIWLAVSWRWWCLQSPVARWRWILGLAALGLLLWMAFSTKPWTLVFPDEGKPRLSDVVKFYAWWAAAMNVVGLAVLATICPWWAGKEVREGRPMKVSSGRASYWLIVCGAAVVFLLLALPRMEHSLWVDEDFMVRDALWGGYRVNDDGEMFFRKQRWDRVLYFYETPNNHIPYSALARVCLDLWQTIARPSGLLLAEWPMRIPSLLAGLGVIFASAWCLRLAGMPFAGLLASCLAALQPWLIRLSAEARGFSLLICLVLLLLCFLQLAWRTGKWRWWAGVAFSQFGIFYVFPAAIYVLVVGNLAALLVMWFDRGGAIPAWRQTGRWFVSTSLAGLLVIQLMLPLLPQMLVYLRMDIAKGIINWPWTQNFLGNLFVGVPWTRTKMPVSDYPELLPMAVRDPWLYHAVLGLFMLGFVIGSFRLLTGGWQRAALWAVGILPAILAFLGARLQEQYLFDRYLLFLLPGAIVVVAVGFDGIRRLAERCRLPTALGSLFAVVPLILYAWFASPVYAEQIRRPNNPIRDSVLLTRPSLNPWIPEQDHIITATFSFTPVTYDPHVHMIRTEEELFALMEEADRRGLPLYLNIGNPWSASVFQSGLYSMMTNEEWFEPVARLRGWDATMDRMVARYRPGSWQGRLSR